MKVLVLLIFLSIMLAFILAEYYVKKHKNLPERCEETGCRLENWRFAFVGNDKYIFGNVYDHPEYTDSKPVRFGPISYQAPDLSFVLIGDQNIPASLEIKLGKAAQ